MNPNAVTAYVATHVLNVLEVFGYLIFAWQIPTRHAETGRPDCQAPLPQKGRPLISVRSMLVYHEHDRQGIV